MILLDIVQSVSWPETVCFCVFFAAALAYVSK